jgi:hypothetical protein
VVVRPGDQRWRQRGVGHWDVEVLGSALAAAVMKGPRQLCQRDPSTGAAKGSRHGGCGGDDGVPVAAACAPVASLMAFRRRQRVREMKICQVIQVERRVPNLLCQVPATVLRGTAAKGCISIAVVPMNRC